MISGNLIVIIPQNCLVFFLHWADQQVNINVCISSEITLGGGGGCTNPQMMVGVSLWQQWGWSDNWFGCKIRGSEKYLQMGGHKYMYMHTGTLYINKIYQVTVGIREQVRTKNGGFGAEPPS